MAVADVVVVVVVVIVVVATEISLNGWKSWPAAGS